MKVISKKNSSFFLIYVFTLLVELFAVYTNKKSLEVVFKPFLSILLLITYMVLAKQIDYRYILILFLSLVSDYLLIFRKDNFKFILGVVLIGISHLIYIKIIKQSLRSFKIINFAKYLIPFLVILGVLFFITSYKFDEVFYVLLIHALLLLITINFAFLKYIESNRRENLVLFLGFFLFFIADCFYTIYKFFDTKNILYILLVTLIYAVAQYLICRVMIYRSLQDAN